MSDPLVTCLCLTTAGRKEFLTRAIDCFRAQTYPYRELLIVADSDDDLEHELGPDRGRLPNLVDDGLGPDVFGSAIIAPPKMTVGTKRNLGCLEAAGDIIAIWDDDDYSAPGRLEQQVKRLQFGGRSVTGYCQMLFTDGSQWWRYDYPQGGLVFGTSLMFKREWWKKHPFEELQVGEDVRFSDVAFLFGELSVCPNPDMMYATIHPGNTCPRQKDQPGWTHLPGFRYAG